MRKKLWLLQRYINEFEYEPQKPSLSNCIIVSFPPSLIPPPRDVCCCFWVVRYNHTGTVYFNIRRDAGLQRILIQAKLIMREALPIQCVEALFLAVHITSGPPMDKVSRHDTAREHTRCAVLTQQPRHPQLMRLPMSFKSRVNGRTFKHIVLAVCYKVQLNECGTHNVAEAWQERSPNSPIMPCRECGVH